MLLSITPAIADGIAFLRKHDVDESVLHRDELWPLLGDTAVGRPIAHIQVIALSKLLKKACRAENETRVATHLDDLLRGSRIHYESPPPKAKPTDEYKTLMARLRYEEEARVYERMVNPPQPTETFEQRFPRSSTSKLFSDAQAQVAEDDEMTYADVNRQMALIINILVSIVACSVALWLVASSWSVPSRLALSMGGSILIAVAEAVVYAGYLRRVKDAREQGKKQVEVREIIKTWVIGSDREKSVQLNEAIGPVPAGSSDPQLRKRNVHAG
ncbi:MAG: hypothetical protein Q9207_000292 [Kuettlingeria erythrocarpa]